MNGILFAGQIENITTRKDQTVKITIGTQELSPGKAGEIFQTMNKLVAVYLSQKESIPQKEIDQVDQLDPDLPGKTQSQRLRAVLYKLFEKHNEGYKDFEMFYRHHTEIIIEHLKKKIDP